ncbi:MAG: STAS domain-containing protein, partial [Gammaproteobacteria bacterium]|nr:STAS domain-containing protein [Gammaproteobacteria bacterium]
ASACSGAFPVTGGFARSVVNYDAGASTPAAGAMTAVGIGLVALFFTPYLYHLPVAVLAATIIVAVLSLLDMQTIIETWRFSRSDFSCLMITIAATLLAGVESGVLAGVVLSIGLHLYHSSRPHYAVVGLVGGTEHFRNRQRHDVLLSESVLTVRIDESLYFANARFLEDRIYALAAENLAITDMVLMCPAINDIDASALDSLEAINERLASSGVRLHLSEVKGPVMDKLQRSTLLERLTGKVFLTQFEALTELDPGCLCGARGAHAEGLRQPGD